MATWDEVHQRMANGGMVPNAKGGDYQAQQLAASAAMGHIPGQGHRSQPGGVGGQGRWAESGAFIRPEDRGAAQAPVGPQQAALAAALRGAQPGGMANFGFGSPTAIAQQARQAASGYGEAMPSMGGMPGRGAPMQEFGQSPNMGWEMGMPQQPGNLAGGPQYQQPANPWAMQPPTPQPSQWQGFNAGYSQQ